MSKPKNKYYVVRKGYKTGIFTTRPECEAAVKGFAGAQFKGFPSLQEAKAALKIDYKKFIAQNKPQFSTQDIPFYKNSIAVDAACSRNPGIMEYQGIDLENGKQIFHQKFQTGTNNIGEFLAIVHGLSYINKFDPHKEAIYTDSRTAIGRILQKKCKTNLIPNDDTQKLFEIIKKAIKRLQNNKYSTKILKRDTENRGEIPADFGRK